MKPLKLIVLSIAIFLSLLSISEEIFAQTNEFSYAFSLSGITEIIKAEYRNGLCGFTGPDFNFDRTDHILTHYYDSASTSFGIKDTCIVSYYKKDGIGSEYEDAQHTITIIIDTVNKVLKSFSYELSTTSWHMRSNGYSYSSLLLTDIKYIESPDGSISLFLTKKDVLPHIKQITYSSSSRGAELANTESVNRSLTGIEIDTEKVVLRMSLGKPIPTKAVFQSSQKIISLFPNPVTNVLHIELDEPVTTSSDLEVYSPLGQKVKSSRVSGEKDISLYVGDLSPGAYFIKYRGITYKIYVVK